MSELFTPDEKTIEIITRVFSPKIITIGKEGDVTRVDTEDGEHCASFGFYTDSIFIEKIDKCGITKGTDLLQMFDQLAEEMPNIKYIELDDASDIKICEETIRLYLIKILTNGQSWYNSHGYFSQRHESNKSHNEGIINMEYEKFRDIVYRDDLKRFKSNNSIHSYKYRLNDSLKKLHDLEFKKLNKIKPAFLDDPRDDEYYKANISKYTDIIENYDTRIVTIIDEYIKQQEADIKRGIDLFPHADINNKTAKDYFNYVWSDITRNIREKGCKDEETIEKCKWLSNFIDNIHESNNLIKYYNQLKKTFRPEDPVADEPVVAEPVSTNFDPLLKPILKPILKPTNNFEPILKPTNNFEPILKPILKFEFFGDDFGDDFGPMSYKPVEPVPKKKCLSYNCNILGGSKKSKKSKKSNKSKKNKSKKNKSKKNKSKKNKSKKSKKY
jgi:hypothetical protein